jgi:CRP-like cAMP-binding protein
VIAESRRASSPEGWNKAWAVAFSREDEQGTCFSLTLVTGGTEDATHPKCCRAPAFATLPLATYQAGETVLTAGTKTGRLLILRKGAVTIEKEGTEITKVMEPGAVFGELSALLDQPHTADVRTLETSEFRVAPAELLDEDPVVLLYVVAILAQRLNLVIRTFARLCDRAFKARAPATWQSSSQSCAPHLC